MGQHLTWTVSGSASVLLPRDKMRNLIEPIEDSCKQPTIDRDVRVTSTRTAVDSILAPWMPAEECADSCNQSSELNRTIHGAPSFTAREMEIINRALGYFGREDHFNRPKSKSLMAETRALRQRIVLSNRTRI